MKPAKKRLGIDFDDVLIDFVSHLAYFHNTTYNTSHTKDEYTTWNLLEVWGVSEQESMKRIHDFVMSNNHKEIIPMEGATESLYRLSETFELVIITARDTRSRDNTFHLIEKHFGNIFSSVHFLYENGVKQGT